MSAAAHQDSDELEALFDSIVAETTREPEPAAPAKPAASAPAALPSAASEAMVNDVVNRLGQLTRSLHDSMRELGYDRMIEKAAQAIPDAQDRLQYIAAMTEQAASRTLSATEAAQPIQEHIGGSAESLGTEWDRLYANQLSVDEFKDLAGRTRTFLKEVPGHAKVTNEHLLEIMMAQDFQDLTGQVIKKIIHVAQELESQLMGVLIDTLPGERRTDSVMSLLNGPVINAEGRGDVVATQQQVDDLLGSLGF